MQPNALNYCIKGRQLSLYDKLKEKQDKGEHILKLYHNKNVLRYEKKYLHRIANYFNCEKILVKTLFNERFYMNVIDDWYKDYLKIQKEKRLQPNLSLVKTKREMELLSTALFIDSLGGTVAYCESVKERQSKKELTKKQAKDLRDLANECNNMKVQMRECELITELDKKMKEAVRYYR